LIWHRELLRFWFQQWSIEAVTAQPLQRTPLLVGPLNNPLNNVNRTLIMAQRVLI